MADKIIILRTAWGKDYWEKGKEAPFPHTKYSELQDWNTLSQNCPLPGLGVYIKQRIKQEEHDYRYKPFVYLRIEGMRSDIKNGQPYFTFTPVGISKTQSKNLEEKLQSLPLFSALPSEDLLNILRELGETPPQEWTKLINSTNPIYGWRDYIGKYFLELTNNNIGNNDFEDRSYGLLKAIGFCTKQLGHDVVGEYPDGKIFIDNDIVVVYDCKNREGFVPSVEDSRKLSKYAADAKIEYKDKKVYGVFIAKSMNLSQQSISYSTQQSEFPVIQAQELLYVLYKKLYMGKEFTLNPFRKILAGKYILNRKLIDNEWR